MKTNLLLAVALMASVVSDGWCRGGPAPTQHQKFKELYGVPGSGAPAGRKAYIVGAGIAGLSTAVFLVRDGQVPGRNVYVIEEERVTGGAMDGLGTPEGGYLIRGGRMLNFPTYECFWALLKTIPSLGDPARSVMDDVTAFNQEVLSYSRCRLVDKDKNKLDVSSMGFTGADRLALLKFAVRSEKSLGTATIQECFPPSFFRTEFWYMWATTFAFQPWHSAAEMKRYMNRFIHEFPRLQTLEGICRTRYNQYDSVILPIQKWLEAQGVHFDLRATVVDLDFAPGSSTKERTVERLRVSRGGQPDEVAVGPQDLVFVTNGSMTEGSTVGSHASAPTLGAKGSCFKLWENIVKKQPDLGDPSVFADHVDETKWESFTVTCRGRTFFDSMIEFSGNQPGTGGLVTFKDSSWLLSVVCAHQPHFANQPEGIQVFWGYSLFGDRLGDCVKKKMADCTGEEILREICFHLGFQDQLPAILAECSVVPCMMPFITSQFQPRTQSDRPPVVPMGSTNFAFIGQYCEIPDDCVFTVEYSVRSAQMAVYGLLDLDLEVPPINKTLHDPKVLVSVIKTMFR